MSELSIGKRIEAFSELADRLRALHLSEAEAAADPVRRVIADQVNNNPWFTEQQVDRALQEWIDLLSSENLSGWTQELDEECGGKTVALIPAGFTSPAIDAFIRDFYRHASCFLCQK